MTQAERLARIDEIDRFEDWLTDHDPWEFLQYARDRRNELEQSNG